jgi:hypothetical protein
MKIKLKTSIVLYGQINAEGSNLWEWFQYTLDLNSTLGFKPTHIGIIGESFKSGKITTIPRVQKKLQKALLNNERIDSLSTYSLPEDFHQAAFDYQTEMCLVQRHDNPFVIITIPSEIFRIANSEKIISQLSCFINSNEGEIFELSVYESPLLYANKANEVSEFQSLNILSRF